MRSRDTFRMKVVFRGLVCALFFAGVLMCLSAAPAYASQVKVAVVDVQRILENSEEGKRAAQIMEREVNARRELFENKQKAFMAKKEAFDKQSTVWSPQKRAEEEAKLQQEFMEIQQMGQQAEMEMQKRQMDLMQPLIADIKEVVEQIGEREKFDLIFAKNSPGMLYMRGREEITDRVINEMAKKSAQKKKN